MEIATWAAQDFEIGMDYVEDHEEQATASALLETDRGLKVILPKGLPALGVHFLGIYMMAPLLLFMAVLAWLLFVIWSSAESLTLARVLWSLLCLGLFWGLTRALKLLLTNRELFPRRHFVTLGDRGIAMHFSRLHFLPGGSRTAIPWKEVRSVQRNKMLFPPAWLMGVPRVPALEVVSARGEKVRIPFHPSKTQPNPDLEKAEQWIRQKMKT
ncbi:MAG: hypothetical protein ACE5E9_09455 [Nitrospinaceae bacterium]